MVQSRESDHEPTHSSSEEEEASSEEASESESEEKQVPPTPPITNKPSTSETIKTPSPAESSSSDESDSGSGFESDSPRKKSAKGNTTIKPIASKPMDETLKTIKKSRSKPNVPTSPPTSKSSSGAKRPMPESETKDSKRARKKATDADNGADRARSSTGAKRPMSESETKDSKRARQKATDADNGADGAKMSNRDDEKKQLFQRLWSEDDEIVILKGMMDYTAKKGAVSFVNMNDFHDFIKKSLNVNVSNAQLSDKVRRLKKKYQNNAKKEIKGTEQTFSKKHEQRGYELSEKIWGNSSAIDSTKVNGTAIKNQSPRKSKEAPSQKVNGLDVQKEVSTMKPEENVGLSLPVWIGRSIGGSGFAEEIIKGRLESIMGHKRMELEEKWKKQHVEEVALYLKRVELVKEQTKLVLEDLNSSEK